MVARREEVAIEKLELEIRAVQLEEERDRLEGDKLEMAETQSNLEGEHDQELSAKHEQFSQEHVSALESNRLYDKDMLDKSGMIKD